MWRVDPLTEVYRLLLRLEAEAEQKKTAIALGSEATNATAAGATQNQSAQQVDSSPLRRTTQVSEAGHDRDRV